VTFRRLEDQIACKDVGSSETNLEYKLSMFGENEDSKEKGPKYTSLVETRHQDLSRDVQKARSEVSDMVQVSPPRC
jgi:hypothetical protein